MGRLKIGSAVEVTRINGEKQRWVILGLVEYLAHIGEFYRIGTVPTDGGKGRKAAREFGMYHREDIRADQA